MTNKVNLLSFEIKTMWLCILLLFNYSNAIYLPDQDLFANKSIEDLNFDPGPTKIKLESPSKSTLALTSGKPFEMVTYAFKARKFIVQGDPTSIKN